MIKNCAKDDYYRTSFVLNWMTDSIACLSNAVRLHVLENEELIETAYGCLGHLIINFLNALQVSTNTHRSIVKITMGENCTGWKFLQFRIHFSVGLSLLVIGKIQALLHLRVCVTYFFN